MKHPYLCFLGLCLLLTSCLPEEDICDEERLSGDAKYWFESWGQIDSMTLRTATGDSDTFKLMEATKVNHEFRQGDSYCYTLVEGAHVSFKSENNLSFDMYIVPGMTFRMDTLFSFNYLYEDKIELVNDTITEVVKKIDTVTIQNVVYSDVLMAARYNPSLNDTLWVVYVNPSDGLLGYQYHSDPKWERVD